MSWRESIVAILDDLPPRFDLAHVYRHIPRLRQLHPDNRHIADKIQKQLQILRDEGTIRFLEKPGTYERVVTAGRFVVEDLGLRPGETTTRHYLADLFEYKGIAALNRGMFKPAKGPYRSNLLLFHDERQNPYGDDVGTRRIHYIGEGMQGDQSLSGNNKHLEEHLERGYAVHYFTQPADQPGKIRYDGQVFLEKTERVYRSDESRTVLQFTLIPQHALQVDDDPRTVYGSARDEIFSFDGPPRFEERERVRSEASRLLRDPAFRREVLTAYNHICAVCGDPLEAYGQLDLQAAHILGVAERGPDDIRNGLSLCGRHHWAFDHGVFSLADDHTVLWLPGAPDPHGEIEPGARIHVPKHDDLQPDEWYLEKHRAKWHAAS